VGPANPTVVYHRRLHHIKVDVFKTFKHTARTPLLDFAVVSDQSTECVDGDVVHVVKFVIGRIKMLDFKKDLDFRMYSCVIDPNYRVSPPKRALEDGHMAGVFCRYFCRL
jgi:hypothetical protein